MGAQPRSTALPLTLLHTPLPVVIAGVGGDGSLREDGGQTFLGLGEGTRWSCGQPCFSRRKVTTLAHSGTARAK